MHRNRAYVLLGIAAAAVFGWGMVQLLLLRFSAGDVYPYYSSLRSDPLGAKALYESLDQCCGLDVSRNYEPFEQIRDRADAAILFTGEYPPMQDLLPLTFVEDLEHYLNNGGRMVVTYISPEFSSDQFGERMEEEKKAEEEKKKQKDKRDEARGKDREKDEKKDRDEEGVKLVSFSKRWGLTYRTYPTEGSTEALLADPSAGGALPHKLSWHSTLYFDRLDPAWQVIYTRENKAVVVARRMGKGIVILSADSYFLSNEAMLRDRHPDLLAWLIGDRKHVIFDEYFHGISVNPGVAALARRYRLHGLIAGILLLVGLFIWKNSTSLVPPHADTDSADAGEAASGKDSASGLTNLLRRSIPGRDILKVCWQEWRKTNAQAARTPGRLQRMEALLKAEDSASLRQRNPVQTYNRISEILKER